MREIYIQSTDMPEDMQQDVIECAWQAFDKTSSEDDIAKFFKKEFDKKYEPAWHCIVGRNFGSRVIHQNQRFIFLYVDEVAVLLFKTHN